MPTLEHSHQLQGLVSIPLSHLRHSGHSPSLLPPWWGNTCHSPSKHHFFQEAFLDQVDSVSLGASTALCARSEVHNLLQYTWYTLTSTFTLGLCTWWKQRAFLSCLPLSLQHPHSMHSYSTTLNKWIISSPWNSNFRRLKGNLDWECVEMGSDPIMSTVCMYSSQLFCPSSPLPTTEAKIV